MFVSLLPSHPPAVLGAVVVLARLCLQIRLTSEVEDDSEMARMLQSCSTGVDSFLVFYLKEAQCMLLNPLSLYVGI